MAVVRSVNMEFKNCLFEGEKRFVDEVSSNSRVTCARLRYALGYVGLVVIVCDIAALTDLMRS